MLKGFPVDFPISVGKKDETGLFVRNEIDETVADPLPKKAKIVEVVVVEHPELEGKENQNDNLRHVKFSVAPPVEYLTFPDSEYDRSSLNKPNCKYKRHLL